MTTIDRHTQRLFFTEARTLVVPTREMEAAIRDVVKEGWKILWTLPVMESPMQLDRTSRRYVHSLHLIHVQIKEDFS